MDEPRTIFIINSSHAKFVMGLYIWPNVVKIIFYH
jgi:hypothetical protein